MQSFPSNISVLYMYKASHQQQTALKENLYSKGLFLHRFESNMSFNEYNILDKAL